MSDSKLSLSEYFASSMRSNLPITVMSVVVAAACLSFFVLQLSYASVAEMLRLSPSTSWGIFTLMFVHNSWDHLSGNVLILLTLTILLLMLNSMHSEREKRKRAIFFVIIVVGSAVLAHTIWLAIIWDSENPTPSAGASGLTYAFKGAVLSLATQNALDAYTKLKMVEDRRRAKLVLTLNGLVAGMLVFLIVSAPAAFLNITEGSNYFGHMMAFLFGLFGIMVTHNLVQLIRSAVLWARQ